MAVLFAILHAGACDGLFEPGLIGFGGQIPP